MANENKDVLRVVDTDANIDNGASSTIRQKQIGFSSDEHKLYFRDTGDNIYKYSPEGGDVIGGDLYTDQYVYHNGDLDTYINFTADNIAVQAGGNSNQLVLNSSGYVGVGADPDVKCEINLTDTATNSISDMMRLSHNTSGTVANGFGSRQSIYLEDDNGDDIDAVDFDFYWETINSGGLAWLPTFLVRSDYNLPNFYFSTYGLGIGINATESFGVSANQYLRQAANASGSSSMVAASFELYNGGYSASHGIYLRASESGTIGTLAQTDNNTILGQIVFNGVDSGTAWEEGAVIQAKQNGAASTYVPTNLIFSTYSSSAENSNQMVMHSGGTVLIGTDTATGGKLEVRATTEQLRLEYDATKYATFTTNSSGNIKAACYSGSFYLDTLAAGDVCTLYLNPNGNTDTPCYISVNSSAGDLTIEAYASLNLTAPSDYTYIDGSGSATNNLRIRYDASNYAQLSVDSNGYIMFDATGDRLCIGDNSPLSRLHIYDGNSSGVPASTSGVLIENSGSAYLNFLAGTASSCYIYFGDQYNNNAGEIRYNHSSDEMHLLLNLSSNYLTIGSNKIYTPNSGIFGVGVRIGDNAVPTELLELNCSTAVLKIIDAAASGTLSTQAGYIQVSIGGTTKYIPAYNSVS